MNEKIHFVCLLNKKFKDNVKSAHWVGNLQLISLDTYALFKITPCVDEKQASVTVNTMKQSVSGKKRIQILSQEEEYNVSEETNDYADVKSEANKINDKKKDIVVKMKEEIMTLEYQETMNIYIEKIASKKQPFWR